MWLCCRTAVLNHSSVLLHVKPLMIAHQSSTRANNKADFLPTILLSHILKKHKSQTGEIYSYHFRNHERPRRPCDPHPHPTSHRAQIWTTLPTSSSTHAP